MIKIAKPAVKPVPRPPIGVPSPVSPSSGPSPTAEIDAPSLMDASRRQTIAAKPGSNTVTGIANTVGKVTGYAEDGWIPGGPLQGFLTTSALGLGGGWLASKLWNALGDEPDEEKDDRTKRWSIIGGLVGAVPSGLASAAYAIPSIQQHGVSGLWKYPTKTATVKKAFDWPPKNDMPLFQTVGAIAGANDLSPAAKAFAIDTVQQASQGGELTYGTLLGGAIGAGLGLMVGSGVARVLNAFVGLPDAGKKIITTTGLLGGALKGVGLI